jgi:hypothetical protein
MRSAMQQLGAASVVLREGCTATAEQLAQAPSQMPITVGMMMAACIIVYCDKCGRFLRPGDRWFGCLHDTACEQCVQ